MGKCEWISRRILPFSTQTVNLSLDTEAVLGPYSLDVGRSDAW